MGGRRNEEKKKERKNSGGKEDRKKKSFAGFKPVRLVLLVVLSVEWEGMFGRFGFTFLPS